MQINEALKQRIVRIDFTKVDGSNRIMNATLNQQMIEELSTPSEKKTDRTKTTPEGVLAVFDVDNKGWRSMRVENIISWT